MTPTPRDIVERLLKDKGVGQEIAERVLRIGAPWPAGQRLKGFYRSTLDNPRYTRACITKGEFIRANGREAWNLLPTGSVLRHGRRKYISHQALCDKAWIIQ